MKIGILTFWWSEDNYGQQLQAYALQRYLRDAGHDAFLIRYNHENEKGSPLWKKCIKALNFVKLVKVLKNKIRRAKVNIEQSKNDRKFSDFRKDFINFSETYYNSYDELKQNPPDADCYIGGSDQVWNPYCIGGEKSYSFENSVNSYFLNFGSENIKRISYAASWGTTTISKRVENLVVPLLKRFDFVSVREESGIELCKQCGFQNAEWVCDPTLLLKAVDYRKIYRNQNIRKQNRTFLLLYMLNNEFKYDIQKVYDFAETKNLQVVYVTGNGVVDNRQKFFATIPEWLYLVDNAEYVITNSFHCGVFSTIFGTKFGVIPLCGVHTGMNARFDSLFKLRGIEQRFLTDDFSVVEKEFVAKNVKVSEKFLEELNLVH